MGSLIKHPMRIPPQEGTLVYFHCDDCEILSGRAKQNGGRVFKVKWSIGQDGYLAILAILRAMPLVFIDLSSKMSNS